MHEKSARERLSTTFLRAGAHLLLLSRTLSKHSFQCSDKLTYVWLNPKTVLKQFYKCAPAHVLMAHYSTKRMSFETYLERSFKGSQDI